MDGQPGQEDGEDAGQDRDPEPMPPASGAPDPARPGPDPRLAEFAWDDSRDGPVPSGRMALLADQLSGPERRCPGANSDELVGLLRAWAAIESWAAGAKLGVIREIMRREAPPSPGSDHGDLPETWSPSLRYELAGALACSTQSAETTASLAWQLGARLPRIGARLDDGTLTSPKARAVAETLLPADRPRRRRRGSHDRRPARGQDLHPGPAPGRAGRPDGRAGAGRAAARARAEELRPSLLLPRAAPVPPACPAATCPPTRLSPRWPPSTPAPRSTRNRTRSATRRWTSCVPTPTSTSSTACRPPSGSRSRNSTTTTPTRHAGLGGRRRESRARSRARPGRCTSGPATPGPTRTTARAPSATAAASPRRRPRWQRDKPTTSRATVPTTAVRRRRRSRRRRPGAGGDGGGPGSGGRGSGGSRRLGRSMVAVPAGRAAHREGA